MTVEELIDKALDQGDLVPPGSQDYIDRRRLALSFLQEVFEDAYWRRQWPSKRKGPETLTVPAGQDYVAAPLDFQSIGTFGGLYDQNGEKLLEVHESVIIDMRESDEVTDTPGFFALFGQDPTTYRIYFQFPPHDAAMTFNLWYQPRPPRLLDAGDPDAIDTYYASSVSRTGSTVTFATTQPHDFHPGDIVLVAGANESEYNGSHTVTAVGASDFDYEIATTPSTPATGTISVALNLELGNWASSKIDPQYHHSVLLNGTKAKLRESKGDARWQYLVGEFEKGILAMMKEEQRLQSDGMKQIPSFFGGMGRSRY